MFFFNFLHGFSDDSLPVCFDKLVKSRLFLKYMQNLNLSEVPILVGSRVTRLGSTVNDTFVEESLGELFRCDPKKSYVLMDRDTYLCSITRDGLQQRVTHEFRVGSYNRRDLSSTENNILLRQIQELPFIDDNSHLTRIRSHEYVHPLVGCSLGDVSRSSCFREEDIVFALKGIKQTCFKQDVTVTPQKVDSFVNLRVVGVEKGVTDLRQKYNPIRLS